nr:MMPL family transporter [Actinomadura oligospora]
MFGVATDYALLLVARYREELRRHADRHEAMAAALRRVGPAILASAGTVAAGMLCLLAATMNSNRGLGPVAAAGVIAALAAMTTLLPALLVTLGRWIFWPLVPKHEPGAPPADDVRGLWGRVGRLVARPPPPAAVPSTGPRPSSSTCTTSAPADRSIRTVIVLARACRTALVTASWTIRYPARSTSTGSPAAASRPSSRTARPAATAWSSSSSTRSSDGAGATAATSSSTCRSTPSAVRSSRSVSRLACLIASSAV